MKWNGLAFPSSKCPRPGDAGKQARAIPAGESQTNLGLQKCLSQIIGIGFRQFSGEKDCRQSSQIYFAVIRTRCQRIILHAKPQ